MTAPRIFVSYRRDDARQAAGRLADHLRWEQGIDDVFFDKSSIAPGAVFPKRIDDALQRATHVLVVIGPKWSSLKLPGADRPRLFDDQDFVRREVATALAGKAEVIPVCVDGAKPADIGPLPPDLEPLRLRNAYVLDVDAEFADELRRLIVHLTGHEPSGADTPKSIAGKVAGGAAIGLALFLLFSTVLMLLGVSTDQLFPGVDPQAAQERFALLPWAFTLFGALLLPLLRRRWHWPRRRDSSGRA
jgi:hypothetical protein